MKKLFGFLWVVFLLASCVPLKNLQRVEAEKMSLQSENEALIAQNDKLLTNISELEGNLKRLDQLNRILIDDTVRLARKYHSLNEQYENLQKQNLLLAEQIKTREGGGASDELMSYLQKLQNDLQKREDAMRLAEGDALQKRKKLEEAVAELELSKTKLANQQLKLLELENALAAKEVAMKALRNSIVDALTGFGADELSVQVKDGKVYVAMEEKLLFSSGSYEVNAKGISALKKLGLVLQDKPDIAIMVEGHTDDVPFKSGMLLDNWDLSVKRATSVVRILLKDGGVQANRLIAAGRSQFIPVASGTSAQARQKNRRIEIILTPTLDKVLQIIEGK